MAVKVGKHRLEEERFLLELHERMKQAREYTSWIVGGAVALVAVVVAIVMAVHHHNAVEERAWDTVFSLKSADEVAQKAKLVEGTSAEPFFILEAGNLLFSKGRKKDLQLAEKLYRRFCNAWPEHPLVFLAQQSLGYVLEQEGKYAEAFKVFAALARAGTGFDAQSVWDAARCAEYAGMKDKALELYRLLADNEKDGDLGKIARFKLSVWKAGGKGRKEQKHGGHEGNSGKPDKG